MRAGDPAARARAVRALPILSTRALVSLVYRQNPVQWDASDELSVQATDEATADMKLCRKDLQPMTTKTALELASFDDLAAELGRRYDHYALIVNEPVLIDASKFLERQAFKGDFNVVLGLIDTLHETVMAQKKEDQSPDLKPSEPFFRDGSE
jgi:hypothetical protein